MSTPSDHELIPLLIDEKPLAESLWHQWREKRVEELNQQQVTKDANALQLKDEKEEPTADYYHSRPTLVKWVRYGANMFLFLLTGVMAAVEKSPSTDQTSKIFFGFITILSAINFVSSTVLTTWLDADSFVKSSRSSKKAIENLTDNLSAEQLIQCPFVLSPLHFDSLQRRVTAVKATDVPDVDRPSLNRGLGAISSFTFLGVIAALLGQYASQMSGVNIASPFFNAAAIVVYLWLDHEQAFRLKRKKLQAREDLLYTLQTQLSALPNAKSSEQKYAPDHFVSRIQDLRHQYHNQMQEQLLLERQVRQDFEDKFEQLAKQNREMYYGKLKGILKRLPTIEEKENDVNSMDVSLAVIASLETRIHERLNNNAPSDIAELFNSAQNKYKEIKENITAGTHEDLFSFENQLNNNLAAQYLSMQHYEANVQNLVKTYRAELATGHAVKHALDPQRPLLRR